MSIHQSPVFYEVVCVGVYDIPVYSCIVPVPIRLCTVISNDGLSCLGI